MLAEKTPRMIKAEVLSGLDLLMRDGHSLLRGRTVGLLMNQASVNKQFGLACDLLAARSDFRLGALFGPQHGLWGTTQDNMIEWQGFQDRRLRLPVHSLYGEVRKPSADMLRGLEVMVIDLMDVGARYYTFLWTATLVMEACREAGIAVLVLDRPNPINGVDIEGPMLDERYASFVGRFSLPMRHGMTMGEMLNMFNQTHGIGCDLTVLPCGGWKREMWLDETDMPWAMPSPNMPSLETAAVYPGMCLLEGTLLSEGRGTTRPFEIVGAPYIDAHAWLAEMQTPPGCTLRPLYFQPTFQKHAGQTCGGFFVHVTNRDRFRSTTLTVELLRAVHRLYPQQFAWKQPPYEYETVKLPFDILAGSTTLRDRIEAGVATKDIVAEWEDGLRQFERTRRPYLLYP